MSAIDERNELIETSSDDLDHQARVALSAVARLQGEWGTHMIACVLRGSEKKRVLEAELDELSIYGMLDELTQAKLVAMLEALIDAGLVCRGAHQCLGLTPNGTAVMLGKRELTDELRDALEKARNATRKREPAERYKRDSWTLRQTLKLVRRGLHPRMIARKRDLAVSTIVEHIFCLAAQGQRFDLTPHLDVQLLEELRQKAAGWRPGDPLTPVRESLDDNEVDWTKFKLHLVQVFRE